MTLVLTLAQNFRVNTPQFDSNEFRVTNAGLLNAFKMQSEGGSAWLTPELKQKAMLSAGRDTKIPVINYKDVTVRTTRPLVIPADENTSTFYTVVWTTVAAGFAMYPAQHYNNDIARQKDFDAKMKAIVTKFTSHLEGLAQTAVDADKTQVINEISGPHAFASNVVSETGIGDLKDSYILTDIGPMQNSNDYDPFEMDVVGNQGLQGVTRRIQGFDKYNSETKTIMFDGMRFGFSNSIANALGKKATGYAIPDGTLGMLVRVEPDSVMGTKLGTSHEWGTIVMPGLNLPFGTYSYEGAVDINAVGAHVAHLTRTGAHFFDFAADFAFITKYSSNRATIPGPIIKFDIDTV